MLDTPQVDPAVAGQSAGNDPQGGQSSGTPNPSPAAPSQPTTPENLQGKSQDELVKMYGDLNKKLGEQGGELGNLRKYKQQMDAVLEVIAKDQPLYQNVETALKKAAGTVEDNAGSVPTGQATPSSDGDAETRSVVEGQLINEFAKDNGLNGLTDTEKAQVFQAIGKELVEIYDPSGKKNPSEVIKSIPLPGLRKALDKSFVLVQAKAGVSVGSRAEIGGIPSAPGGSNQNKGSLSPAELEVAKKQGVTPDEYLKNKQLLINGE